MVRLVRSHRRSSARAGVTIVELLIAIAIIGILASIGVTSFRQPGARLYANDLRALTQQARYEAVKLNIPIGVIWSEEENEFRTVRGAPATPCVAMAVLNRASPDEYRGVVVTVDLEDGLVWLPSGQARSCSFGAFEEAIATISDAREVRVVTVTLTGRVTIE